MSPLPFLPLVLCLITPWLQMDCNRQIDQIATLSHEHIISCAYRLHSEAGVILGAKQKRSKQTISEAIVNILRQSLLNVQSGSTISKPHRILLHLRITDDPACLHDPQLLSTYLLQLLGPPIYMAFVQCDDQMDDNERSKRKRYTKRQPYQRPHTPVPHPPLPPPASTPILHSSVTDWPKVVPCPTDIKCCRDYYESTKWVKPQACAVCSRAHSTAKMKIHLIPNQSFDLLLFDLLRIPTASPHFNSACFQFGLPALNNIIHSYHADNGEWRMETLVKWSVFEHRDKGAGPDPAALLKGTCVLLVLISAHANIKLPVRNTCGNARCRREKDLRTNERKNDELEMRMKDDVPDKEIESGGFN